ncbi:hypothetical protein [Anaeromicrobium sediminis]|uniref:AdoMet activation domain-containing protein n=1 Tax=Anaeromicrobium sediminis TaxID=1478221 RepID=A0A267MLR0_9FIRM|nr:hypothetical protein [Anaeromicrobium sediminis]PAB60476.1 hypothetical protein CCE28_06150 [Anaeromicrobium sediminis]
MKVFSDFNFTIDKKRVFNYIDCYEGRRIYKTISKMYEDFYEKLPSLITPKGFYNFVNNDDSKVPSHTLYCVITLGEKISEAIGEKYDDGEYIETLLLDAMADMVLFEYSNQFYKHLKKEASKMNLGLSSRNSPGERGIPMEYAEEILNKLAMPQEYNISLTSGFMVRPNKSMIYSYKCDTSYTSSKRDHDCSKCSNENCKMRSVKI